jgi:hypothetical protein
MTKYEKLTLGISILALGVAAASPYVAYRWLDPQLQAFQNRGRLQLSIVYDTPEAKDTPPDTVDNAPAKRLLANNPLEVKIINVGELPAKDVLVTAQYDSDPKEVETILSPPMPTDITLKDQTQFITLKRAIAPHDSVNFKFMDAPKTVWAATEFGETSTVSIDPFYKSLRDALRAAERLNKDLKEFRKEMEQKHKQ